jgi:hypothetical protein
MADLHDGLAIDLEIDLNPQGRGNNNINVYQYNTMYVTLTLRPLTSETNMESHKDPDIAEKNWVHPTSTLRLTSGLALRSTLRLTLTLSGNNNTNVYQYNTIYMTLRLTLTLMSMYQYKINYQYKQNYYMTLTLRPMTSESKMESQKDPDTGGRNNP